MDECRSHSIAMPNFQTYDGNGSSFNIIRSNLSSCGGGIGSQFGLFVGECVGETINGLMAVCSTDSIFMRMT